MGMKTNRQVDKATGATIVTLSIGGSDLNVPIGKFKATVGKARWVAYSEFIIDTDKAVQVFRSKAEAIGFIETSALSTLAKILAVVQVERDEKRAAEAVAETEELQAKGGGLVLSNEEPPEITAAAEAIADEDGPYPGALPGQDRRP